MKLFILAFLSLAGLSSSAGEQNKTKRWLENDVDGIRYPSAYQQVSRVDDSTKSIGTSRPSTNSYNTPQPLILFTPAAVLEQQEARVRHIYLKQTPSSPPPPSSTTLRAKTQKLEAQPQLHSYSTFILPPQLQSAVVPTTYPIRHQPTAFYGYARVPPVTAAPVQQQLVKHVYLDQKHPVFHYHYQTYPNSKPLVIHNSIPQNAPKQDQNENVKEVTEPQEEVNEEVKNGESEEEEEEEAPERENVQEDDEDGDEREPVKQQQNYDDREDDGGEERENLEEEEEEDEEEEEKENLEEEDEEDNRQNHGPQVFYRNNQEDDEEPEQRKRYRNEESEDEEEEENQHHDVKIKPNFGFDYQRFANEYKNIQYPKPAGPIRVPLSPFVVKQDAKKKINPSKNAKPYPNVTKKPKKIQQKPNAKVPSGANVHIQLPYPIAARVPKISNIEQQKSVPTNNHQQQTVPVIYQRLRNYFTPTPIINSQ